MLDILDLQLRGQDFALSDSLEMNQRGHEVLEWKICERRANYSLLCMGIEVISHSVSEEMII